MKTFYAFFLLVGACGTLPHAVDDLGSVHDFAAESLQHRFQVERFSSFGAFLRYGPIGSLMGPWRYAQRSKEDLADPSEFCAQRIKTIADAGEGAGLYSLESIELCGRILLADPYTLSRIFAGEALGTLGTSYVDAQAWTQSLQSPEPGYGERVKLLASELASLAQLIREGKSTPGDAEKLRKNLAELAVQRYAKPQESLAILRLILNVASLGDAAARAHCEETGKHLAARTIPRVLLEGLRDTNEFVREGSLVSLHRLVGKNAFAEVFRAFSTENSVLVRRRLAKLCAELSFAEASDPKMGNAIDFLLTASRDAEGSLAASAMESLSRILGMDTRWDREFWKAWGEEYLLRGTLPPIRS